MGNDQPLPEYNIQLGIAIHADVDCFEALTEKFQVPDKKAKTNRYSPCSLPSSQQHWDQIVFKRWGSFLKLIPHYIRFVCIYWRLHWRSPFRRIRSSAISGFIGIKPVFVVDKDHCFLSTKQIRKLCQNILHLIMDDAPYRFTLSRYSLMRLRSILDMVSSRRRFELCARRHRFGYSPQADHRDYIRPLWAP